MFICRNAEGFFPISSVSTSSAKATTVPMAYNLEHWSWLRAEVPKPLAIPELNNFDGSKRFAETVASRLEGTWREKAEQLLQ